MAIGEAPKRALSFLDPNLFQIKAETSSHIRQFCHF